MRRQLLSSPRSIRYKSDSPYTIIRPAQILIGTNLEKGKPSRKLGPAADPAPAASTVRGADRRAKIICTVGPACNSEGMLRDLMRLGMDVARLNFSHGSHEEHAHNIERLRRAADEESRTICILQDLQGPKIRTGRLKGGVPVVLQAG